MSDRKVVRVSDETEKFAREYGASKEIGVGEAIDALVATAKNRLQALKRYASNKQPQSPGKPRKKAATKKVKKAKSKSRANGSAVHASA